MALRKILVQGDPALGKPCRPVEKFDRKLHQLLDDMQDTLYDANGAGLAAPQVGVLRQVCIVDVGEGPIELINPEIISAQGEQTGPEGCLSLPDEWWQVTRPMEVTVRAQNRKGKWFEVSGKELCARAFCHEIDHLHGIVFVDKASRRLTAEELEAMREK